MVKESDFKSSFCKKLKKLGAIAVIQYEQNAKTVKGFPDTIVIFEGIVVFIEFKASKRAKFQPLQKEWVKKLNDNCHFAYIVCPETANDVLKEIKEVI